MEEWSLAGQIALKLGLHEETSSNQFDAWTANFQVPLEEARQGLQTQVAGAHRRAAQTIINHTSAGYLRCLLHKCKCRA